METPLFSLRAARWWAAVLTLAVIAGCARLPGTIRTPIKAGTFGELQRQLSSRAVVLEDFRAHGPFEVERQDDVELRVSGTPALKADLFFAAHKERAPLVIIVHGYGATKEMHAYQAQHVASWGLHALTVQVPNKGPWVNNARALRALVTAISQGQVLRDARIDGGRIILAGHSFGASSVAVALAEGAKALGGILLDPATTERAVPVFLGRNKSPLMIIGADEDTTATTNRALFFKFARSRVFEVSVRDAVHEDAQYPADTYAVEESRQITFAGALVAAALSLHLTGGFDYAWASYASEFNAGKLLRPKQK